MKNNFTKTLLIFIIFLFGKLQLSAADRYWVHKPFYENFFSTASELSDWSLVEDNGAGGWALSGSGTAILTMDNAAGSYANRLFNVNGGPPRLLPLNSTDGRVEIMVKAITGGNQRIFVQVQQFDASNVYLGEFSLLPGQSATGFFSINLSDFTWDPSADKVRFIIGGENYSGQQGTVEFDYFSYSNGNGDWNNSANWSATSAGAGGATVPGIADVAIFDGATGNNGSCLLTTNTSVSSLQFMAGYSGNFDLRNYQLTVGTGGLNIAGGGVAGNAGTIIINGSFNISGGAFKNISGYNYVNGDISITGGVLDLGTGHLVFNATGNQQFTSTLTNPIHKLIVDKSSGVININSDMLISDTLVLSQGEINTNSYIVSLGTSATATGELIAGTGKINGSFKRWVSGSTTGNVLFPFGTAGIDAPFTVIVVSAPSTGGSIAATYTDAVPGYTAVNFLDNTTPILLRSAASWDIQIAGLSGGLFSLAAANNHLASIVSLIDLHLTTASSVVGIHQAATGTLLNPVLNRSGLTAANLAQTYYASLSSSILSVTWLSFDVLKQNEQYTWKWKLGEENNVAYYEPQYSLDGINFITAGSIHVFNNDHIYSFTATIPQSGNKFFRVKEIESGGKISYSFTKKINTITNSVFSFYPNPANTEVSVIWPYADAKELQIRIVNSLGREVIYEKKPYNSLLKITVANLPAGNYIISCSDDKKRTSAGSLLYKGH